MQHSCDYDKEERQIKKMFPGEIGFTISICTKRMTEEIKTCEVLLDFKCCCYTVDPISPKPKSRRIIFKEPGATIKDVIDVLIKHGLKRECSHYFLEDMEQGGTCYVSPRKDPKITYLVWGS